MKHVTRMSGLLLSAIIGLGAIGLVGVAPRTAEANTNNNFTNSARSEQCSRRAQEIADREERRRVGRGAAAGAVVGGVAGRSLRGAGIGAGAGAATGMVRSHSARWQTTYNREYRACINR